MTELVIVAHITAKEDQIEQVNAELDNLVGITRAEQGCIQYDLHQDNENPAHFMFYERWESKELWLAHVESEHLKAFIASSEKIVETFTVNEMTKIK